MHRTEHKIEQISHSTGGIHKIATTNNDEQNNTRRTDDQQAAACRSMPYIEDIEDTLTTTSFIQNVLQNQQQEHTYSKDSIRITIRHTSAHTISLHTQLLSQDVHIAYHIYHIPVRHHNCSSMSTIHNDPRCAAIKIGIGDTICKMMKMPIDGIRLTIVRPVIGQAWSLSQNHLGCLTARNTAADTKIR